MSRYIRTAQTTLRRYNLVSPQNPAVLQSKRYSTDKITKSPFESNILRILHNEIQYQSDYAPPRQPITKFKSFEIEDRPGEQWMTMRSKFNNNTEDVKVEATMFDGCQRIIKSDEDNSSEDVHFHISLLIDVTKDCSNGDSLEFMCSAWSHSLEIQKVYLLKRNSNNVATVPYMGPNFRDLKRELQVKLGEYLEERGVNDELCVFLHEYMMNKDRIELIRWLDKVKSFVET